MASPSFIRSSSGRKRSRLPEVGDLPVLKPREVVAILQSLGFAEIRQRGSHNQFSAFGRPEDHGCSARSLTTSVWMFATSSPVGKQTFRCEWLRPMRRRCQRFGACRLAVDCVKG
ncbi:MAG TPA: type II toxin-antitoxin system HicA family toxin [Thermoanaerobaculia bacterium]|nr:type II toxin-antitoxin system HicA family toxin [Thermoanaerobaculia bacterium]